MADGDCGACEILRCGGSPTGDYRLDYILRLLCSLAEGGSGSGSILDGTDPEIAATVFDYTNSDPLAVRLTDTNGDYVAPGGGIAKVISTGTIDFTTTDTEEFDVSARKSMALQIFGTFAGTAVFEGSVGPNAGDNWFSLTVADLLNDPVDDFIAPGVFFFDVTSLNKVRVRVSVTGSGTASYTANRSTV